MGPTVRSITIWAGAQTVLRARRSVVVVGNSDGNGGLSRQTYARARKSAGHETMRSMVTACMQMNAFLYLASTMRRTPPRRTVKSENLLLLVLLPPFLSRCRGHDFACATFQGDFLQGQDLPNAHITYLSCASNFQFEALLKFNFKTEGKMRDKREKIFLCSLTKILS